LPDNFFVKTLFPSVRADEVRPAKLSDTAHHLNHSIFLLFSIRSVVHPSIIVGDKCTETTIAGMSLKDLDAAEANIHLGIISDTSKLFKDESFHDERRSRFRQTVEACHAIVVNKLYKQKSHRYVVYSHSGRQSEGVHVRIGRSPLVHFAPFFSRSD